jgi:hypothetical protein
MQIEIKNLKVARQLSEETVAYTATVYVDGKQAFHASNNGHGGCDLYRPVQGYTGPSEREINDWLKANHEPYKSEYGTLDYTLEMAVGDLIAATERKKRLDSILRTRIAVLGQDKAGKDAIFTYPAKYKPTPENIQSVKTSLAAKKDPSRVINGDPVLYEKALSLV